MLNEDLSLTLTPLALSSVNLMLYIPYDKPIKKSIKENLANIFKGASSINAKDFFLVLYCTVSVCGISLNKSNKNILSSHELLVDNLYLFFTSLDTVI